MWKYAAAALIGAGGVLVAGPGMSAHHAEQAKSARGYTIHTRETVGEPVKAVFDGYVEAFGGVPNIAGLMGDAPALMLSYAGTQKNLQEHGTLSPAENNIIQLAISVDNGCGYCTAAHTMVGKMMHNTPDSAITAIRSEAEASDPKVEALRSFALSVYENRGRVSDEEMQAFIDAGFSRQQSLDVVTNIAAKVMSNYTNQLVGTPIDAMMRPFVDGVPADG